MTSLRMGTGAFKSLHEERRFQFMQAFQAPDRPGLQVHTQLRIKLLQALQVPQANLHKLSQRPKLEGCCLQKLSLLSNRTELPHATNWC